MAESQNTPLRVAIIGTGFGRLAHLSNPFEKSSISSEWSETRLFFRKIKSLCEGLEAWDSIVDSVCDVFCRTGHNPTSEEASTKPVEHAIRLISAH